MKEQVEEAIADYIETNITYQGERSVDIIVRGKGEKPDGESILIIDMNHNADRIVVDINGDVRAESGGEMFWIFKIRNKNGDDISELAEEKNDRIPEITLNSIIEDDTLGGRLPGRLNKFKMVSGLYELREQEGVFFHVTHLIFGYEGAWIPPSED
jgi:hypothetical protein